MRTHGPTQGSPWPAGGPLGGHPAGHHRGIRRHRPAGGQPGAGGEVRPVRQPGDGAQRHGRAGVGGLLGHPHTSAGRVPTDRGYRLLRRVDRRRGEPGARRAAHDPPPVRPGRVRQRAVVPPRGRDARLGHAGRGHRHAGQAAHLPGAACGHPVAGRTASASLVARARGRARQAGAPGRSTTSYRQEELDEIAPRG